VYENKLLKVWCLPGAEMGAEMGVRTVLSGSLVDFMFSALPRGRQLRSNIPGPGMEHMP
jgi:hypothetical protein